VRGQDGARRDPPRGAGPLPRCGVDVAAPGRLVHPAPAFADLGLSAGMPRQSPVTVRAQIVPGQRDDVDALLRRVEGGPAVSLGLSGLRDLHFARIFVLDAVLLRTGDLVPESLVYMAD